MSLIICRFEEMWEELQVKVDQLSKPKCEAWRFYCRGRRPHH